MDNIITHELSDGTHVIGKIKKGAVSPIQFKDALKCDFQCALFKTMGLACSPYPFAGMNYIKLN